VRSTWRRSATPGAGDIAAFRFDRVTAAARDSFAVPAGPEGVPEPRPLPVPVDRLAALVATARDTTVDERCIANPVWVVPVQVEIGLRSGAPSADPAAFLPPGSLRLAFHFPVSMSATAGMRVCLRPLDERGVSTEPELELVPDPGWEAEGGIAAARYTVTNAVAIPAPAGEWDALTHTRGKGRMSFVVYLERPADVHGNVLNDVARAFAIARPGAATTP
jgi:hypothetical protein